AKPVPPESIPGGFQSSAILRVFVDRDSTSYFGEASATQATAGRDLKDFALGAYYHISSNLKLGAFAAREFGLRHDEDWQLTNGSWSWVDSNGRGGSLFALD